MDAKIRLLLLMYRSRRSASSEHPSPQTSAVSAVGNAGNDGNHQIKKPPRQKHQRPGSTSVCAGNGGGIIGVVSVNGNGFYPANSRIQAYLTDDALQLYLKGAISSRDEKYPLDLVLIGWQTSEARCYYQEITVDSQPEKSSLFAMAQLYATIIYGKHFKPTKDIRSDWILNTLQLDRLKQHQ